MSRQVAWRQMSPRVPDRRWLVLACALPGSAFALGLGDIHVESALGRPLAAQIDLLDASPADLGRMTAVVASADLFQRHGLLYPSFLASTTLSVAQDKNGRSVLVARSSDSFTEPMVTLLVEVHSPEGNLLREYTLLLDPPGFSPAAPAAVVATAVTAQPAATTTAIAPAAPTPIESATPPLLAEPQSSRRTYTVSRRDTLRRIADRVRAHSGASANQTMIAIFRDNPTAFDKNINLLHAGAILDLPTPAELSAIAPEDASREFSAQMLAWSSTRRRSKPALPTTVTAAANPVVAQDANADGDLDSDAALRAQIASLQASMDRIHEELSKPLINPTAEPAPAATVAPAAAMVTATNTDSATTTDEITVSPRRASHRFGLFAAALAGALLIGYWIRRQLRKISSTVVEPRELDPSIYREVANDNWDAALQINPPGKAVPNTAPSRPEPALSASAPALSAPPVDESAHMLTHDDIAHALEHDDTEPTVEQPAMHEKSAVRPAASSAPDDLSEPDLFAEVLDEEGKTVELKYAFFNPESTINTTHVMIPSGLHDAPSPVERRRSPADVLRQAIEKEPGRHDLRLKLLELYYTAAAQNQQAFLQIARQLASNGTTASDQEWAQIADMGRKIAPDDDLFVEDEDDQAVA